jgi:hypothetical protein
MLLMDAHSRRSPRDLLAASAQRVSGGNDELTQDRDTRERQRARVCHDKTLAGAESQLGGACGPLALCLLSG